MSALVAVMLTAIGMVYDSISKQTGTTYRALTQTAAASQPLPNSSYSLFHSLWQLILSHPAVSILVAFSVILLLVRWWIEARKMNYSPELVMKHDEIFNSEEMKKQRSIAARTLKNLTGKDDVAKNEEALRKNVDDILDFFETLGFYVKGDQMSAKVVHQYFYYWICGYWAVARDYVNYRRKEEPKQWEFVEYLFKITCHLDKGLFLGWTKHAQNWEISEALLNKEDFLDDEIELMEVEEIQKKKNKKMKIAKKGK
jgi:hypothetical protein